MLQMSDDEVEKIIQDNRHLKRYIEDIEKKIDKPVFYSILTKDLRNDDYPNFIYPTKGLVFVHIYRTKDMLEPEYHAIEPILSEQEQQKRDEIFKLIIKKVPEKPSVISDEDLGNVITELMNEIIIIDEQAENEPPETGKKEKTKKTCKSPHIILPKISY